MQKTMMSVMSRERMIYPAPSFKRSKISLNKFTSTPFLFCFQFMIDKQDERIKPKCDHDSIDQLRKDDLIQVHSRKLKSLLSR